MEADVKEYINAGANAVLPKPLAIDDLEAVLLKELYR